MREFDQLLEATIAQVERLQLAGAAHLAVEPALLRELQSPAPVAKPRLTPAPEPTPQKTRSEAAPQPAARSLIEGEPLEGAAKEQAMNHLHERALACQKCPNLVRSRRNVVFGVGTIDAELMFVGEAPGMDEDAQGEPFVGKAGQLLTRIIQTMGLSREQVYIGNVLKCRPDTPGRRYGNRKPTPQEMVTCRPYVMEQIRIIRPRVIVALGATAVEGLMGMSSVYITRYRGEFRDFEGIPLMPTYHPSYVLRNQSPRIKRQIWEDMLQVMERLGMPISEKQKGYFSNAG